MPRKVGLYVPKGASRKGKQDLTGNCRGCKRKAYDLESVDLSDISKPLKKRKRHAST